MLTDEPKMISTNLKSENKAAMVMNVLGQIVTKCANNGAVLNFLTSVTFKSRSNQKPGYYVMYPYTYGDDPAISSGVLALFLFLVLAPW
jgi:hypothetical protein